MEASTYHENAKMIVRQYQKPDNEQLMDLMVINELKKKRNGTANVETRKKLQGLIKGLQDAYNKAYDANL